MEHPHTFSDFFHHPQPLRYVLMVLLQRFQLIEDVVENVLNNLDILELARFFDQLFDGCKEAFLLVLPNRNGKIVLDIFKLPVEHFQLVEVVERIRKRQKNSYELG
jgi:hypothetical protein